MKRILDVKKQIGQLSKSSTNPFFKSQYLNLNDLLNEVEPLLWEQQLVLIQPIEDGKVYSRIVEADGNGAQKIVAESSLDLPDIKDPQKLGSCITYFRRYTLKSLLSISEEDDDGNKASKPEPKPAASESELADILICDNIDKVRKFIQAFELKKEDMKLVVEHGKSLKDESK